MKELRVYDNDERLSVSIGISETKGNQKQKKSKSKFNFKGFDKFKFKFNGFDKSKLKYFTCHKINHFKMIVTRGGKGDFI